eukprot:gene4238-biopygen6533
MLQSLLQQFHDVHDQWRDFSEQWALHVCSRHRQLRPLPPTSSPSVTPPPNAFAEPGADQCPFRTGTATSRCHLGRSDRCAHDGGEPVSPHLPPPPWDGIPASKVTHSL